MSRPARPPRRALHGVLLVDKPLGWTSRDALAKAMGLLRAAKGGHTGTLDPLATGLLPLALGAAAKFAQVNLEADKRYRATLRLGERTSTGDGEGEVVERRELRCGRADVEAVLARFMGAIEQLPPMHSAVKQGGRALYEYARAGVAVERRPRRVTIHRIALVAWEPPLATVDVHCSKGTYIRTLAEDIGAALGCGATLAALRRTASGPFDVADAITPDALAALDDDARLARLLPPDALLAGWPAVQLAEAEAARFLTGLRRRVALADAAAVRVYAGTAPAGAAAHPDPRAFLGSAHITAGELIADRLLSPQEVQAAQV
ncbi:MAG: tRNA pseudouridine(55) synthase TruB [Comamonadaceae bacterium]|nr:tRNA pseudouridine(55) synthase TruB [Comamonadaceae bacterium]